MKTKSGKIAWMILSSFIVIFLLNIMFLGGFSQTVFQIMTGDINTKADFNLYRFFTISVALLGETLLLSGTVFITSKKFFNDENSR